MTDNIIDFDEKKIPAQYKAALEALKEPLFAASDAAHKLRAGDEHLSNEEFVDNRVEALGWIVLMASDFCGAHLQLLESIVDLLWKKHSGDDGDDE